MTSLRPLPFAVGVTLGLAPLLPGADAPERARGGRATDPEPEVVLLWPDGAPGSEGAPENERVREREGPVRDRHIANVHAPTLTVYLPEKEKATGAGVVICPGGGYAILAIDKEGHDVARWLASIGVAGFVLKYRLPRPEGHVYGHEAPLADARRALRTVRSRATEWKVDPGRIGIMGFSAGGHLASTAGTHLDGARPETAGDAAPLARQSARPDFLILIYPVISFTEEVGHSGSRRNLIGKDPSRELVERYSNELRVTSETPPAFLVHTTDDGVRVENSLRFYEALRRAGVPAELHVFEEGGHGYALRKTGKPVSAWPGLLRAWLAARGMARLDGGGDDPQGAADGGGKPRRRARSEAGEERTSGGERRS